MENKMSTPNEIKYENKIIHVPPLDMPLETKGLGYAIYSYMSKYKERIAQIDGITGEKDKYGYLLQRCIRAAVTMKSIGITSNDIVTICTLNHLNAIVPYFAALFIGAKVSALDPSFTVNDTVHLLKEVTPRIIFISPESIQLYEKALKEFSEEIKVVVFGKTGKYLDFSEFLLPKLKENEFKPTEIENLFETAIIFFSSGMAGLPKGICLNHYAILGQVLNSINYGFCMNLTLTTCSLYWTTKLGYTLMVIFTGSTHIILPTFHYDQVYSAINKYKPTMASIDTGILYEMACNLPKDVDVSSLKHITRGGAPLTEKQVLKIRETFFNSNLYSGYGQTETFLAVTLFKPGNKEDNVLMIEKPTSCGGPLPGFSYMVVDPDTEEILGPYQRGELRLKTKFALNGYHNRDSSFVWDKNGWYKTGDIVYYDNEFCFYFVERIREMLKYREWHVEPAALERILKSHPAVASAVVIGIPHEVDGDHPMAIVTLNETCKDVTAENIKKFVDEKVDDRKRLRGGVKIVDSFPTTTSGKIIRKDVKNMVLRAKL